MPNLTKRKEIDYFLSKCVFTRLHTATLRGGEFPNCHGIGETAEMVVKNLIIEVDSRRSSLEYLENLEKRPIKVFCPNRCYEGKVKHYSDSGIALWEWKSCKFCKGEGWVLEEDYDKIDKTI